jgi:hypothetical protein
MKTIDIMMSSDYKVKCASIVYMVQTYKPDFNFTVENNDDGFVDLYFVDEQFTLKIDEWMTWKDIRIAVDNFTL